MVSVLTDLTFIISFLLITYPFSASKKLFLHILFFDNLFLFLRHIHILHFISFPYFIQAHYMGLNAPLSLSSSSSSLSDFDFDNWYWYPWQLYPFQTTHPVYYSTSRMHTLSPNILLSIYCTFFFNVYPPLPLLLFFIPATELLHFTPPHLPFALVLLLPLPLQTSWVLSLAQLSGTNSLWFNPQPPTLRIPFSFPI